MTLEEQWQEDVKQFGELAYLMWEAGIKTHHDKTSYLSCLNNFSVELLINAKSDIRRKKSAALPFDLAAALAGDAVEILTCNEWLDCSNDYALYLYNNEGHDNKNSKTHLRMKHPRRVAMDYSQFED